MAHLNERDVFAKTVYAEARGESREGQTWVSWVIKNRAYLNKEHFGGNSIKNVCLKPYQFECWNNKNDIETQDERGQVFETIRKLTNSIYDAPRSQDPTGGADHYNNPTKEGHKPWVNNCRVVRTIGQHVFYKEL